MSDDTDLHPEAVTEPAAKPRRNPGPEIETLPLVPLRDNVVLPHQLAPLGAGRERSVSSLEAAVAAEGKVVLAVQRQSDRDDVELADIYPIATIAQIGAFRRGAGGAQVLVEGQRRVRVLELTQGEQWTAKVVALPELEPHGTEIEALVGSIRQLFAEYVAAGASVAPELAVAVARAKEPGKVADLAGTAPDLDPQDRIALLQEDDVERRLRGLVPLLARLLEVAQLRSKIQQDVAQTINQGQREAILREQLKVIRKELADLGGESGSEEDLRERITAAGMPEPVLKRALKELDRMEATPSASPEVGMIRNYLDWLVELPWGDAGPERVDIQEAARILDEDHYGLPKVKERILEWMAVRKRVLERRAQPVPEGATAPAPLQTPILCFVGPPGVGKTSLGRSIARALDRKLVRVSLGGIRDEAEIRGHRRTYIGALPGRIIQGIRQAGTNNPVFLLDEIDKLGLDYRGDPSSALLEVLDPDQNAAFSDHYLEVPFDLSSVFFITTANSTHTIPRPLLDRMEVVEMSGYTEEEKVQIAKGHLLPQLKREHGLERTALTFSDDTLLEIIRHYTKEGGVRQLRRQMATILRKLATRRVRGLRLPRRPIGPDQVAAYLGPGRFEGASAQTAAEVGIATGMYWSEVGGDVMPVEVSVMPGRGQLLLTGQLGDVMRESAQAGFSYVRAHWQELGVAQNFYRHQDVHIHVPDGAAPKEGPSAGVTMATALVSALTARPVRSDLAMTGEVTLRGRVLPIGGLKEKVLAAHRVGIRTVIIPRANLKDLADIPNVVRQQMTFVPVGTIAEVLDRALLPVP